MLIVGEVLTGADMKFLLLHESKNDEGIRTFFMDVWELYVKVSTLFVRRTIADGRRRWRIHSTAHTRPFAAQCSTHGCGRVRRSVCRCLSGAC